MNVSLVKIKKIIEFFEEINEIGESLKDKYFILYIFGFCKVLRYLILSYCKIIDFSYFVNEFCDKVDEDMVQDMIDVIWCYYDYILLYLWSDKDLFEIIFNIINCNVIKYWMSCEGSLFDMFIGLKEINEVIIKGII